MEVGALTGTLTDACEHRGARELASDTRDHFLDQNGLADAGATEQADLSTLDVRGEKVDDLDAGLHELGATLELVEGGGITVDAPLLAVPAEAGLVEAVAECVEDVALDDVADRNGDRLAGVTDFLTADEAVGRGHRNGTDHVVAEVLGSLEGDGLGDSFERHIDLQGVVQCRQLAARELHVDDRADDTDNAPGSSRCGVFTLHLSSCSH